MVPARLLPLLLLASACGRDLGPEESLERALTGAREVFTEHGLDPADPPGRGTDWSAARWRELRRDLREAADEWLVLPRGLFWGHPVVDYGTARAVPILLAVLGGEGEWRVLPPEDPGARQTTGELRYPDGPVTRRIPLELERRGGKWVITGRFEPGRPVR